MTDLISRQAAIKAVDDLPNCYNGYSDTYDKAYIIGVLEELPTAVPKDGCEYWDGESGFCALQRPSDPVKHGKWIADKYTRKCSECGSTYWMREGNAWNYCPNCGSKNGGKE